MSQKGQPKKVKFLTKKRENSAKKDEQPKKVKFLTKKRQEPYKNEEKQKENIFLMPEPPKVKNNKFTTYRHAEETEMQQEIDNWDGNDITTLPFVNQEKSVGHDIEEAVRPLLQDWVSAKREQQKLEEEIDLETEKRQGWSQLNENGKNITIIKQRVNNTNWCELNKKLCDIQKQITKNTVEISHNTGQIKKQINTNLIFPIYEKYGGKARSSKEWANYQLTIDGKYKNYHYQKKNKPIIWSIYKPDVIKKIQEEHNIKNLKGLIDYLDKQPKDTNTYRDKEIKEIIMYAKWLILKNISSHKTYHKNITSDQTQELSAEIKKKLDPAQQYTFEQMVDTITKAHTTYINKIKALKLNNNNNQIQQANNANNQVEIQPANNIINNQAEQMDLLADIPLEDVLVEEIENKNNPFDLNFEVDQNQEFAIDYNNENVFQPNTVNNNMYDLNNTNTIFNQDIYIKK